AVAFAAGAKLRQRLPLRIVEIGVILAVGAVAAFAARGLGDVVSSGNASYRFRVSAGYRVPVVFEPDAGAETTDAYSLGDEVEVRCRYVDRHGHTWYSVSGQLNDVSNPWLPASDVVPDLPNPSPTPPAC